MVNGLASWTGAGIRLEYWGKDICGRYKRRNLCKWTWSVKILYHRAEGIHHEEVLDTQENSMARPIDLALPMSWWLQHCTMGVSWSSHGGKNGAQVLQSNFYLSPVLLLSFFHYCCWKHSSVNFLPPHYLLGDSFLGNLDQHNALLFSLPSSLLFSCPSSFPFFLLVCGTSLVCEKWKAAGKCVVCVQQLLASTARWYHARRKPFFFQSRPGQTFFSRARK